MRKLKADSNLVTEEMYQRRCVELASYLGASVHCYDELPTPYKDFFEVIGYAKVCSLMVIGDASRGRSERECARKFQLKRSEVQTILRNSRLKIG